MSFLAHGNTREQMHCLIAAIPLAQILVMVACLELVTRWQGKAVTHKEGAGSVITEPAAKNAFGGALMMMALEVGILVDAVIQSDLETALGMVATIALPWLFVLTANPADERRWLERSRAMFTGTIIASVGMWVVYFF